MAKQINTQANPPKRDMTPDQALREDWPSKHAKLAPYITENGRMRGGLSPSDQKKAQEILRSYGF